MSDTVEKNDDLPRWQFSLGKLFWFMTIASVVIAVVAGIGRYAYRVLGPFDEGGLDSLTVMGTLLLMMFGTCIIFAIMAVPVLFIRIFRMRKLIRNSNSSPAKQDLLETYDRLQRRMKESKNDKPVSEDSLLEQPPESET